MSEALPTGLHDASFTHAMTLHPVCGPEDRARLLLELIAVAGEPTTRQAAARAAALDDAAVDEACRLLTVRHLILNPAYRGGHQRASFPHRFRDRKPKSLAQALLNHHRRMTL